MLFHITYTDPYFMKNYDFINSCWCKNLLAPEKLESEKSQSPPGPAKEV